MAAQLSTHQVDILLARLAARQHGVVARWQLLEAGASSHQIEVRLRAGRLHQLHRGVYLVGHTVPPPYAKEMSALLVLRNQAVLSHRSAASLWRLLPYPAPGDVCVTVPSARGIARPKLSIYRADLHRRDIRYRERMPLTSPPRTLLDLAAHSPDDLLESYVAEAEFRGLASGDELASQLARNPRKRGSPRLRRVLDLPGGPQRTRSGGERALLALLRRQGITGFKANARVHGYEVDFFFEQHSLVVETDGFDGHSGRVAFERDRLKGATLTAQGLAVMHVSGRQVRNDPDGVIGRLLAALGERRPTDRPAA